MYNDWWDRTCCLKICLCMKKTLWSKRTKMTMIWEEWTKMCSCCTLIKRTEFALFAAVTKAHWYRMKALCAVRFKKQICITLTWLLLLLLLLLNVSYKSQCWKVSIKENFHIQEIVMKRLKKWIVISLYKTENHVSTSNKNLIYKSYLNNMKTTC